MFESVLYFVLGFLCSALIALMVSPAIWHRAVVLTKKQIESSVPLSLNEIQADKDQLRAEFAMSTRRLEHSLEELRETTANQVIEINRKRDELAKLSSESRAKIQNVEELDAKSSELRGELGEREMRLQDASGKLRETEEKLENAARELEQMRSKLTNSQTDADSSRIELVAKQTAIEEHSAREKQLEKELQLAKQEIKQLSKGKKTISILSDDSDAQLARMQSTITDLEQSLKDRDTQIANMRKTKVTNDDGNAELVSNLSEVRAKNSELEAQLASTVLRMEALLEDASNENVEKAMASLNQDRKSLNSEIKSISKERDALKKELDGYKNASGQSWDEERRESATLRERINDLAAQVTAMTAAVEGPDSPINEILKKDKAASSKRSKKAKSDTDQVETLADRIRALQETARTKQA